MRKNASHHKLKLRKFKKLKRTRECVAYPEITPSTPIAMITVSTRSITTVSTRVHEDCDEESHEKCDEEFDKKSDKNSA